MRPKPSREWVMLELERLQVRTDLSHPLEKAAFSNLNTGLLLQTNVLYLFCNSCASIGSYCLWTIGS